METQTLDHSDESLDKSIEQVRVESFMRSAGQVVRPCPEIPTEEERRLRARLILEEAIETVNALGFSIHPLPCEIKSVDDVNLSSNLPPDLEQIVDGCCDVLVVTLGTLSACGVADVGPMHKVLEANQKKFDGGYRDEHGKWRKGPDWTAPDIVGELVAQGWVNG